MEEPKKCLRRNHIVVERRDGHRAGLRGCGEENLGGVERGLVSPIVLLHGGGPRSLVVVDGVLWLSDDIGSSQEEQKLADGGASEERRYSVTKKKKNLCGNPQTVIYCNPQCHGQRAAMTMPGPP